jgi:site-specific DNA-methyltransferase (adenine-specific)
VSEQRLPWAAVNAVVHGDCVEGLVSLPDDAIHLTVTSPPYDNVRLFAPWDFGRVAEELYRVTRPGGVVCWVVQDGFVKGRRTGTCFEQALYFKQIGFWIWEVLIVVAKSYQLPTRGRYVSLFHYCFVLSKGRPTTVKCAGMMKRNWHRRSADGSMRKGYLPQPIAPFGRRSNVWEYATGYNTTTTDKESFAHPALMPEALARDLILSFSRPYDVVLDPFAGAGTTPKMALLNGRRWLGFEIEEKYVAIARERLRKAERLLWVE